MSRDRDGQLEIPGWWEKSSVLNRELSSSDANGTGDAGQLLVCAHCHALGIECGVINGRHMDFVAYIDGQKFLRLQVKTRATSRTFGGDDKVKGRNYISRGLLSYRPYVDGFAFVCLLDPYPYYVAARAITENQLTLAPSCFTKFSRDRSFDELVRRFRGAE